METRRMHLRRVRDTMQDPVADETTSASQTLDRAIARAVCHWRDARRAAAGEGAGGIDCLAEQVRRVAAGDQPTIHTLLPAHEALPFVSSVRRALLEEARANGAGTCAARLSGMVLALDAASDDLLERNMHPLATSPLAGGADLVVEVAHDMRSPLTSILFLVETIREGHSGPVNPVQERQLALVYSAAFGLSSIASDVIELARGSDRLLERTPIPFSVGEVFQSVYDILRPMADEKGLTLRLTPPGSDFRMGYPSALCRVLLNLATNAVKFTSVGVVDIVAKHQSATRMEFSVRDTGPGIPAEVMGELFEPFRRREAGTQSFSSAGLGLAICSRLVSRMDGELRVESNPASGTRFSFELDLPLDKRL
jgi:signal transduction histidine kinase